MVKRTMTRDDVARNAGVSPATVSYVINNGPRNVANETREKVLQAIKELGYQPNALARNLRMQKSNSLGLIIPDNKNTFFAEVALGVEQVAFENNLNVIMCHSAYRLDREIAYIQMLISHQVAGVIWIPCTEEAIAAKQLKMFHKPFVLVDRIVKNLKSPSITVDNFQAGLLITQHLVNLGHKKIGYIDRPVDLSNSIERFRGYRTALKHANIPFDPSLVVRGGFRHEDGSTACKILLSLQCPPTCIIAYNDMNAIGAMNAAQELGLRVPDDISFGGIDDISHAEFSFPALTTVAVPKFEMGALSTKLLIALINDELPEDQWNNCLGVHLKIRSSTSVPSATPIHFTNNYLGKD